MSVVRVVCRILADHSCRGILPVVFVRVNVIRCDDNLLRVQGVGRRGWNLKEGKNEGDLT